MILLPVRSVQRDQFFDLLRQHGCSITALPKGRVRLHHPEKHFLEIWRLTPDDDFIYPDHVERVAEVLGIDLRVFYPDLPDLS